MIAYLISSITSGSQYVGITTESIKRRWSNHIAASKAGSKTALHAAIARFGSADFVVEQIASGLSLDGVCKAEVTLINQIGTKSPNGYNMTLGGTAHAQTAATRVKIGMAARGRKMSRASRDKISKAHKGKVLSKEHRQKLSDRKTGKKMGPRPKWWRLNIAASKRGYKFSHEARAKMSIAKKGKPWSKKRKYAQTLLQRTRQKSRCVDSRANQSW